MIPALGRLRQEDLIPAWLHSEIIIIIKNNIKNWIKQVKMLVGDQPKGIRGSISQHAVSHPPQTIWEILISKTTSAVSSVIRIRQVQFTKESTEVAVELFLWLHLPGTNFPGERQQALV
jgi:hypothetical protein